jgi:6-phosphogluconolactonase
MRTPALVIALALAGCGSDASPDTSPELDGAAPTDGGAAADARVTDAGAALESGADAGPAGTLYAFVGSGDGNVRVFEVDSAAATLTPKGMVAAGQRPSFIAVDAARRRVFSVEEGGPGRVRAFTFDAATASLAPNGMVSSEGAGPTHLSVDPSGKWVLVANYTAGSVAVFPIGPGGALGAASDTKSPGALAHQILTDRAGTHAFVPCLGSNLVAQFLFDGALGALTPNTPASVSPPANAGPRHMALHPTEKFAYVINERASTLTSMTYDAQTGKLAPIETTTTLPAGFGGQNTTAEVFVHPSGRFVYGSNRGHDSIAVFAVDAASGKASLTGHFPTGGRTPRSFALDDEGKLLVAANQGSGTLSVFRVDAATGALTSAGPTIAVNAPSFVGLWRIP